MAGHSYQKAEPSSVCCCTLSSSASLPSSGRTGAADSIGGRACSSYAANGRPCPFRRPSSLLQPHRRPCSLVRSAPITASRGRSGWRAMPVPQPLAGSRSSSAACLMPSPPSSACPPSCSALARATRGLTSERRASPSGCACLLGLTLPRLLSSAARFAPSPSVAATSQTGKLQLWEPFPLSLSEKLFHNLVAQSVG